MEVCKEGWETKRLIHLSHILLELTWLFDCSNYYSRVNKILSFTFHCIGELAAKN